MKIKERIMKIRRIVTFSIFFIAIGAVYSSVPEYSGPITINSTSTSLDISFPLSSVQTVDVGFYSSPEDGAIEYTTENPVNLVLDELKGTATTTIYVKYSGYISSPVKLLLKADGRLSNEAAQDYVDWVAYSSDFTTGSYNSYSEDVLITLEPPAEDKLLVDSIPVVISTIRKQGAFKASEYSGSLILTIENAG